MKKQIIDVSSQAIARALDLTGKCLPSSPEIPALGGIRIATKGEGVAIFKASDSIGEITVKIPCESVTEMDFVALGGILPHLGSRFASDRVTLSIAKNRLQLRSGCARWNMPTFPGEEWPEIEKKEAEQRHEITLRSETLADALSAVAPAAPRNNANSSYNGACFALGENLDIVATNGHCLHHASIRLPASSPPVSQQTEVIVPQQLVRRLLTMIRSAGEQVRLIFGFRNLTVISEENDVEFYIRGIDFKFPAWRAIKPGRKHSVEFATSDFLTLLQRVSVQESDAFLRLDLDPSKLTARCFAKNGAWATADIPLVSPSPELRAQAGFSLNYLFNAIKACDSGFMALSFSEYKERLPALFQSVGEDREFIFSAIVAQRVLDAPAERNESEKTPRENAQPSQPASEENTDLSSAEENAR